MSHGDTKRGKVYVASMNMRGKWATAPPSLKLNVTSAQSVTSKNRAAFSPMTEIPDGFDPTKPMAPREEKYHCFENWWQSLKKIEGVDHVQSNQWWRKQTAPHRRFPNSKDKRKLYSLYKGTQYNYVYSPKNTISCLPFYTFAHFKCAKVQLTRKTRLHRKREMSRVSISRA